MRIIFNDELCANHTRLNPGRATLPARMVHPVVGISRVHHKSTREARLRFVNDIESQPSESTKRFSKHYTSFTSQLPRRIFDGWHQKIRNESHLEVNHDPVNSPKPALRKASRPDARSVSSHSAGGLAFLWRSAVSDAVSQAEALVASRQYETVRVRTSRQGIQSTVRRLRRKETNAC